MVLSIEERVFISAQRFSELAAYLEAMGLYIAVR
jgi:hypothetical protein